jgi:hypothetical protein
LIDDAQKTQRAADGSTPSARAGPAASFLSC